MKFKQFLKETFIDINNAKTDVELLRLGLQSELDASNLYDVLAKKTMNQDVKELLLDISYEEKVHASELRKMLEIVDPEYTSAEIDGSEEVQDLLDSEI